MLHLIDIEISNNFYILYSQVMLELFFLLINLQKIIHYLQPIQIHFLHIGKSKILSCKVIKNNLFTDVSVSLFSCSVVSDSLWPQWTAACQASLSITSTRSLLKLKSNEVVMPSNLLILCHPLLLLSSIFLGIRVFSNVSLCIVANICRVKYGHHTSGHVQVYADL